jgi:hypothetical protein
MTWDTTRPVPLTKIKDGPTVYQENWTALEDWSNVEHSGLDVTTSLSGHHLPGKCGLIMVAPSATIEALTNVACAMAYDTDNHLFKYNTGAAWKSIGGPIPQGVKMVFYQDTAPTGWTIVNLNDKLVFITKGSGAGGETGGGAHSTGGWTITGFDANVGSTTLNATMIPSHTHTAAYLNLRIGAGTSYYTNYSLVTGDTGATGGGGGHVHPMASHGGTWRPSAYNCIVCSKD